jgi:hypothetical protein
MPGETEPAGRDREAEKSLRLAYAFKAALDRGFATSLTVAEFYRKELGMHPRTSLNVAKRTLDALAEEGLFAVAAEAKPTVYTLTPFGAAFILVAARLGFTRVIREEEVLAFLARREERLVPYVAALRFLRSRGVKSPRESEEPAEDLAFLLALLARKPEEMEDVLEAMMAEDLRAMRERARDWSDLIDFIVEPLADFLEEAEPAAALAALKAALEEAGSVQRAHVLEALRAALGQRLGKLEEEKRELEEAIEKMKRYKQILNL